MKKNKFFLFLILVLAIISCTSETDPLIPPQEPDDSVELYYPGKIGSSFTYNTDSMSMDNNSILIGTRVSSFEQSNNINSVEYILQKNISTVAGNSFETELNFRRTVNGLYINIDTSGFSSALNLLLSDSLISSIVTDFEIDPELNMLSFPFFEGKEWTAFKFNVIASFFGIGLPLTVVEIKAKYEGKEIIVVPALNSSAESEKIKYTFILSLPDPENPINFLNPQNPVNLIKQEFSAVAWFTKNVGLAKIEGNAIILNSLNGNEINLEDTSSVLKETLTSYDIK